MNQIDLSGRNAVVTGGARGIGYAIAQRLLQSGASVSVWDVDPEAAAEAALPRHRQNRRGDRLPPRQGRETGGADARGPVPHRRRERLVVF